MSKKPAYPMLCGLCADQPTKLSQAMHNAAFRAAGLNAFYVAFDTADTVGAIAAMRTLGIRGYSMTLPHKEASVTLVDELSPEVLVVGALNTILNDQGKLFGFNTDIDGVERAFKEEAVDVQQKRVLVLGAGGAARATAYALMKLGASEIVISNRTDTRAEQVASELSSCVQSPSKTGVVFSALPYSQLTGQLSSFAVLANTTPVGSHLQPEGKFPFSLSALESRPVVFDAVTRETKFLRAARERGCCTITGVRMLLHQAVRQFELFTGLSQAPVVEMEQALLREL